MKSGKISSFLATNLTTGHEYILAQNLDEKIICLTLKLYESPTHCGAAFYLLQVHNTLVIDSSLPDTCQ